MVRLLELDARYADVLRQRFAIDRSALDGYLAEEVLGWSMSRLVCEDQEIVGLIQVRQLDSEKRCGLLGTRLIPEVWGSGVNATVKRLMLQLLFAERPDIDRVYLCIEPGNTRSIRAAQKLPYAEEIGGAEVPDELLRAAPASVRNYRWFVIRKAVFKRKI
ncbi:GNAT family N-acetyltransferase [Effusibacillus pohliae]|uniref:GNAT family N-acetyltransferase n=1 Tax=Effusibacillus pohliae TaxID=232270 RepID=UPI00035D8F9A|nr:GNAT family protein [Effusibacillus pohliae]